MYVKSVEIDFQVPVTEQRTATVYSAATERVAAELGESCPAKDDCRIRANVYEEERNGGEIAVYVQLGCLAIRLPEQQIPGCIMRDMGISESSARIDTALDELQDEQ